MKDRLEAWAKLGCNVMVQVLATGRTYAGKITAVDDIGFSIQEVNECVYICFPFSAVIVYR